MADLMQFVCADQHFDASMNIFDNLQDLAGIDTDYSRVAAVGSSLRSLYFRSPHVVKMGVFAPGDLAFGMSRMLQTLMSDFDRIDIGVFRRLDDAMHFLDVPEAVRSDLVYQEQKTA